MSSAAFLTVSPTMQNTTYIGVNVPISATGFTGSPGFGWNVSAGANCPGFSPVSAGSSNSFNYTPLSVSLDCQFTVVDSNGDTGVSNNILVLWNTNPSNAGTFTTSPNLVIDNIPFFFPFITLLAMLMTDYTFAIKKGVDAKLNFVACAVAYTIICYIEVIGGLSVTNYFFLFEFLMLCSLLFLILFGKKEV